MPFTIITNKDYFPRKKTIINSISENLLLRFIYGRDVIGANCVEQLGRQVWLIPIADERVDVQVKL